MADYPFSMRRCSGFVGFYYRGAQLPCPWRLTMSELYDREKERVAQSRPDMGTYGLNFLAAEVDSYTTDGDQRCHKFCYAILEHKGGDWFDRRRTSVSSRLVLQLSATSGSHLPCFMLYAIGELHIHGPTMTDTQREIYRCPISVLQELLYLDEPALICKCLPPPLPLFYHATDTCMRARAAGYFAAARRAILALKN
jgi:hypothetical protein